MSKYENDNDYESSADLIVFFPISDFLNPIFHYFGFIPNHITILSTVSTLISVILFYFNFTIAPLFYFLGYLFDCMDGRMARKYNQGTVFGMMLDLVTDNVTNFLLLCTLFCKLIIYFQFKRLFFFIIIILGLLILSISFGITEAISSYQKYNTDNFYLQKRHMIRKTCYYNTTFSKMYLLINKKLYEFYRYSYSKKIYRINNFHILKRELVILKEFGTGNFNLLVTFIMIFY